MAALKEGLGGLEAECVRAENQKFAGGPGVWVCLVGGVYMCVCVCGGGMGRGREKGGIKFWEGTINVP